MPDDPILIFDGSCGFCRHVVTSLARRLDLRGRRRAWQSVDVAAFGLSIEQVRVRIWYVAPGRRPVGGAAAFAAWLATGGAVGRIAGRLLGRSGVRAAAERVYGVVARNRHRIPGPWEHTCSI